MKVSGSLGDGKGRTVVFRSNERRAENEFITSFSVRLRGEFLNLEMKSDR
jgi:hypothetical protein